MRAASRPPTFYGRGLPPKTQNAKLETLMDTILVVDDEINYLTVMEALLGEAGYEVAHRPQRHSRP